MDDLIENVLDWDHALDVENGFYGNPNNWRRIDYKNGSGSLASGADDLIDLRKIYELWYDGNGNRIEIHYFWNPVDGTKHGGQIHSGWTFS